MRGIEPAMTWTHLIPGFILAGIGAGLINVPLASTAVGVVEPARAGMASGHQLDAAPGRDRHRRRRAGRDLLPPRGRGAPSAALIGFVDGLNAILLVGAVLALVAAATSLVLIRRRDFVRTSPA